MARLIVKSPYISGNSVGGYLNYIGTREGVELLPAGYMEYMAERPRSHGLFGDEDCVDMDAVVKELNEYPGNIWLTLSPSNGKIPSDWDITTLPSGAT